MTKLNHYRGRMLRKLNSGHPLPICLWSIARAVLTTALPPLVKLGLSVHHLRHLYAPAAPDMQQPHLRVAHLFSQTGHAARVPHFRIRTRGQVAQLEDPGRDILFLGPKDYRQTGHKAALVQAALAACKATSTRLVCRIETAEDIKLAPSEDVDLYIISDPALRDSFGAAKNVIYQPHAVDPARHQGPTLACIEQRKGVWTLPADPYIAHIAKQAQGFTAVWLDADNLPPRKDLHACALILAGAGVAVAAATDFPADPVLDQLLLRLPDRDAVAETFADPLVLARHCAGLRTAVLRAHSPHARLIEILEMLGIPRRPARRVSILLATNRPAHITHALANVARQTHDNRELILLPHGDGFDQASLEAACAKLDIPYRIIPCPGTYTLGDCLNAGLEEATGDLITKFDDDDHYGPAHLDDLLVALDSSGADVVGKHAHPIHFSSTDQSCLWNPDKAECFVTDLPGATIMLRARVLEKHRFTRTSSGEDSALMEHIRMTGGTCYSTHPFNFIRVRDHATTHAHGADDSTFRNASSHHSDTFDKAAWLTPPAES